MKVAQVVLSCLSTLRSDVRLPSLCRSHFTYYPTSLGTGKKMNMFNAINNAMDLALSDDKSALLFGEDVGFGGVFRCSVNLRDKYGKERVFNSPLCEQGIAGFVLNILILYIEEELMFEQTMLFLNFVTRKKAAYFQKCYFSCKN
ncbi:hypothetical protein M5D96_012324 [Drosophila gunungcola]|uniref:Transketolase-like pyrimidine-binding domain-containing protein n=1 Tax=Drosophila gunungcola TaxID=103775 RepID=A0A9Q0BKF5_9MUSC|nr:hypothetical protein M5D96_012324 [Drosophila gunungcola]